jgi:hypothetical protein
MEAKDERARNQARAQFESIKEMMDAYNNAKTDEEREEAEQVIFEDPLSIEVRSDWYTPGAELSDRQPTEYMILLCTGGPAVRIIGDLSDYQEPETAKIQYQDWGTFWETYYLTDEEETTLLDYARKFYFGA